MPSKKLKKIEENLSKIRELIDQNDKLMKEVDIELEIDIEHRIPRLEKDQKQLLERFNESLTPEQREFLENWYRDNQELLSIFRMYLTEEKE